MHHPHKAHKAPAAPDPNHPTFHEGEVVDVCFGAGEPYVMCFFRGGPHDIGGDQKYTVQAPSGHNAEVTYRIPKSDDEDMGMTFKKL